MGEAIYVIQDPEQASTMLHPLRLRILESSTNAISAVGLAPMLGVPRQQVNYHLKELERVGLVEFVEERKRGNCVERLYRSVAGSYVVASSALSTVGVNSESVKDRASAEYLVSVGARLIDDIARVRSTSQDSPTLAVETEIAFESEAARAEFAKALAQSISELASRFHKPVPDSRRFRMVVAVHGAPPNASKTEVEETK